MDSLDTNIRQTAKDLLGSLTESEETLLFSVCDATRACFAARLRRGVSPQNCAEAFTAAAALCAVAIYRQSVRQGIGSFQAGTVSVSIDRADSDGLICAALRLIAPWTDCGTAFLGV